MCGHTAASDLSYICGIYSRSANRCRAILVSRHFPELLGGKAEKRQSYGTPLHYSIKPNYSYDKRLHTPPKWEEMESEMNTCLSTFCFA